MGQRHSAQGHRAGGGVPLDRNFKNIFGALEVQCPGVPHCLNTALYKADSSDISDQIISSMSHIVVYETPTVTSLFYPISWTWISSMNEKNSLSWNTVLPYKSAKSNISDLIISSMSQRAASPETLTVQVCFIQYLGLDDLLDDVLQGDDSQHLVEGVTLAFVIHPLHDGQVGFTCGQQNGCSETTV